MKALCLTFLVLNVLIHVHVVVCGVCCTDTVVMGSEA